MCKQTHTGSIKQHIQSKKSATSTNESGYDNYEQIQFYRLKKGAKSLNILVLMLKLWFFKEVLIPILWWFQQCTTPLEQTKWCVSQRKKKIMHPFESLKSIQK